jgi:uncharacterized membrane protein
MVLIVIVVGINVNDYEDEKNSINEIKIDEDTDYENNIYEEIKKIMLKRNAQYNKFNKKNDLKDFYTNEKKSKVVASSPIPIPRQNIKWNL